MSKRRTTLTADPGFAEFGYSIVGNTGGVDTVLAMGVISTAPTKHKGPLKSEDQFRRLRETSDVLWRLAVNWNIDAIAMESLSIPQQTSKQNAIKIGHPYGILAMLASARDIAAVMVTPQAAKKALCGALDASKEDVQAAVQVLFPKAAKLLHSVPEGKRNHAWDALAIYVAAGGTEVMRALKRSA